MAEKVRKGTGAIERLLLPRLNSIDGELKAINTRIYGVEKSLDSTRSELRAEISVLLSSSPDGRVSPCTFWTF
jgi:hypothetical protein